jgi:hypothetical protein
MSQIAMRIPAELIQAGKTWDVQLDLEVAELWTNNTLVDRAISRIALAPGQTVQDGDFTVRYTFDGRQEEQPVRVKHGILLSPT